MLRTLLRLLRYKNHDGPVSVMEHLLKQRSKFKTCDVVIIPRGVLLGIFGGSVNARISKSRPNFISKNVISHTRFQTWPQKSTPVFRPDLVRD